jgi:hypothetical protein
VGLTLWNLNKKYTPEKSLSDILKDFSKLTGFGNDFNMVVIATLA